MAEQSVDVLVTEPVRRFLLDSWDSAGRVRLKVQPIGLTELQVPEEKVKLLRDTVSSLRLDSVLSVGFSLSRSKAAEAVTSGKVQVNWADWQKPDRQVVQGDVLTLRGLGKCMLEEVGNQTKKGKSVYHRQALPLTAPSRLRISCCGSICCGWLVWNILWTLRIFWTFLDVLRTFFGIWIRPIWAERRVNIVWIRRRSTGSMSWRRRPGLRRG